MYRFILFSISLLVGCSGEPPLKLADSPFSPPVSQASLLPTEEIIAPKTTDQLLVELSPIKAAKRPEFRFGKGDVLSVSVYDEPDLTVANLPVRPDGNISYPLIGDVLTEGRTVEEVRQEITSRMVKYIREPRVSVIVQQFNSLSFTVSGEVNRPGVFPLDREVKLTQAIAQTGGFKKGADAATTIEIADLSRAFIYRDEQYLPVDFVELFRNGDLRFDIQVFPGDYIYIPSGLSQEVYILGEVRTPDLFAFSEGTTLMDAILEASGFTDDAALDNVHVVRGSLTNPELRIVDLEDIMTGKQGDILLAAGDIVYIPPTGLTSWNRIISKLLPSVTALQTGIVVDNILKSL